MIQAEKAEANSTKGFFFQYQEPVEDTEVEVCWECGEERQMSSHGGEPSACWGCEEKGCECRHHDNGEDHSQISPSTKAKERRRGLRCGFCDHVGHTMSVCRKVAKNRKQ